MSNFTFYEYRSITQSYISPIIKDCMRYYFFMSRLIFLQVSWKQIIAGHKSVMMSCSFFLVSTPLIFHWIILAFSWGGRMFVYIVSKISILLVLFGCFFLHWIFLCLRLDVSLHYSLLSFLICFEWEFGSCCLGSITLLFDWLILFIWGVSDFILWLVWEGSLIWDGIQKKWLCLFNWVLFWGVGFSWVQVLFHLGW